MYRANKRKKYLPCRGAWPLPTQVRGALWGSFLFGPNRNIFAKTAYTMKFVVDMLLLLMYNGAKSKMEGGRGVNIERFKVWMDQNPLRKFRIEEQVTYMELASILGVNTFTIQNWERGGSMPTPENMSKIAKVVGGTAIKDWARWLANKPVL